MSRLPRRQAGVLLPISALPGDFGIGDFGPSAYRVLRWLAKAGQSYWQLLPLTIPDNVGSPYASPSMMAGNWLLISPELLVRDKFLPAKALSAWRLKSPTVKYHQVAAEKRQLLRLAFHHFLENGTAAQHREWRRFVRREAEWLEPAAWFLALKNAFRGKPWWHWPPRFQSWPLPQPHHLTRYWLRYEFQTWMQWQYHRQWRELRHAAKKAGVRFIGDIQFGPPLDSVEVWSRPDLFFLNRRRRPVAVSGVPPDYFSKQGQRWGTPVYRWSGHRQEKFRWWRTRFQLAAERYDVVRFDHFRGLVATWHIPARHKDARGGHWVASPGQEVWRQVRRGFGGRIIAEDLGHFSLKEEKLRRAWQTDGTRVWQFGWSGLPHNVHAPHHIPHDVFFYSSIHDTNTTLGWWRDEARPYERLHVHETYGRLRAANWAAIGAVLASQADGAIIPIQDYLGLGSASRMNRPGRVRGNWQWRLPARVLTPTLARQIRRLVQGSGR